jgi:hypothetical protein
MSIPLNTTYITIQRAPANTEPFDAEVPWDVVTEHVRAHISVSHGLEPVQAQEVVAYRLDSDICDLQHLDRILDEKTSLVYEVRWVAARYGLGLDHMEAGLSRYEGVGA